MISPAPYLDVAGFTVRTVMPTTDVAIVTSKQPGWLEAKIAQVQAMLNSRLRKRYAIPFGSQTPPLVAVGAFPPPVTLAGIPALGSVAIVLSIIAAGALGTATFEWSADGGTTWSISPALASSGTNPPAAGVSGTSALQSPEDLVLEVTAAGALGASAFQWSADSGTTWSISPVLASSGTNPPAVTIAGTSTLAEPDDLQIQITGAGGATLAAFRWSSNGGSTWSSAVTGPSVALPGTGLVATFPPGAYALDNVYVGQGIATGANVSLGKTGLVATFPPGAYALDNVYVGQGIATGANVSLGKTGLVAQFQAGSYSDDNVFSASTPVPETALAWIVQILTPDVYRKRGVSPSDPQLELVEKDRDRALTELKEAADSTTGLFDLPVNEQSATSAVSAGGPLGYSEQSPYAWTDLQARATRGR